jgi:hypothetical protein
MTLSLDQKRQAALLYYFSSIEFLDQIIERVRALVAFTDTTLDYVTRIESGTPWSVSPMSWKTKQLGRCMIEIKSAAERTCLFGHPRK